MNRELISFILVAIVIICLITPGPVDCMGNVLEMGSELLTKKEQGGMWFVKFYAPWCGYCKKLEPTWSELEKRVRPLGVTVARVDATIHEHVAHQFEVKGFPTLIFFKGDRKFTYSGSRTLDNLEEFVKRVSGPPVDEISSVAQFVKLRHSEKPFFLYYGELSSSVSTMLEAYKIVADKMQEKTYFKSIQRTDFLPNDMKSDDLFVKNSLAVVKGKTFYRFETPSGGGPCTLATTSTTEKEEAVESCVVSMTQWVKRERVPNFSAVTPDTFHEVQGTGNMLALAIVPEDLPKSQSLRMWSKAIADDYRASYGHMFTFGFIRDANLFRDITLDSSIVLPSFFVLDPPTDQYYVPEIEGSELTQGSLMHFLDDVKSGKVAARGGTSLWRRFRRAMHELSKAMFDLFSVSVILAMLVLSVPLIVVSCLCYLLCTMDTTESDAQSGDEDEDDEDRRPGSIEDGRGQYGAVDGEHEGLRHRAATQNTSDDADVEI